MINKYDGYNSNYITFKDAGAQAGSFIRLEDGRAKLAGSNDKLVGMCVSKRNDNACVQTHGYIKCKYTGNPSYGVCGLVSDNGDTVKPVDFSVSGRTAIVVEIDEENKKIGFILC